MRVGMGCTAMLGAILMTGAMQAQTGSTPSQGAGSAAPGSATPGGPNPVNGSMNDPTAAGMGVSDKAFVKKAIMGSNGEIDAAKLALQKSSNDQVKQFAQKMIDDHTKLLDDMHQVAQAQSIKYVDKPSPSAMKLHKKLDGLNGAAFDKAYVDGMVKDHQEDVKDFTRESNDGKMQPVKDAAGKGLPVIQEHTQMIEGIQKGMSS